MIYLLVFTNVLTLWGLVSIIKRHLKTVEDFDDLNDRIEASLDVLDQNYSRLSKLLETPVLFDDPIAVEMVQTAKSARDSMLVVANVITQKSEEE